MYFDDGVELNRFAAGSLNFHERNPPGDQGSKLLVMAFFVLYDTFTKKNLMTDLTIYHNPRCSKSRQTLEILKNHGFEPRIVEYIKNPLDYNQLLALRMHFSLQDFVRIHDARFKELGLSLDDEENLLKTMSKEPKLMQRPIITYKGKAVIGRPPEKVLTLLE